MKSTRNPEYVARVSTEETTKDASVNAQSNVGVFFPEQERIPLLVEICEGSLPKTNPGTIVPEDNNKSSFPMRDTRYPRKDIET